MYFDNGVQELNYDTLIDQLIELKKGEVEAVWQQAALVFVLRERMHAKAGDLAGAIGVSSTYINDLARTFGAFPEDYMRNKEMSFTHHKIVSRTDNPEHWLSMAEENQWSISQLQEAIRGREPDGSMNKVYKLYEKIAKVFKDGGPECDWLSEQLRALL